jgi:hypothetical protein
VALRRVVWYKVTNISEESAASIFGRNFDKFIPYYAESHLIIRFITLNTVMRTTSTAMEGKSVEIIVRDGRCQTVGIRRQVSDGRYQTAGVRQQV